VPGDTEPFTVHTCTPTGKALPFGRKAPEGDCPRCDELRAGAAPRLAPHGIRERRAGFDADAVRAEEIRVHFASDRHRSGGCGRVCTFGDW
jgi:hypothetical protein